MIFLEAYLYAYEHVFFINYLMAPHDADPQDELETTMETTSETESDQDQEREE